MSKTWESLRRVERADGTNRRGVDETGVSPVDDAQVRTVRPHALPRVQARDESQDSQMALDWEAMRTVEAAEFDRLVCHTNPKSPGADRFRLLRMRLRNARSLASLKTILITSALPQDGKTTVSLNLAVSLTEQRTKKVLLIDFDLHRKGVASHLGLAPEVGVGDCLQGTAEALSCIHKVEPLGFFLLAAGLCDVENPTELLNPIGVSRVLVTLAPHFDWVILDSPPVLSLTDALVLAQVVDGTLLVAKAEETPTKAVTDAIELLGPKGLLGVVLNGMAGSSQPYSKYKGYYKYSK